LKAVEIAKITEIKDKINPFVRFMQLLRNMLKILPKYANNSMRQAEEI
jgi:hypothetical protein